MFTLSIVTQITAVYENGRVVSIRCAVCIKLVQWI